MRGLVAIDAAEIGTTVAIGAVVEVEVAIDAVEVGTTVAVAIKAVEVILGTQLAVAIANATEGPTAVPASILGIVLILTLLDTFAILVVVAKGQ